MIRIIRKVLAFIVIVVCGILGFMISYINPELTNTQLLQNYWDVYALLLVMITIGAHAFQD